jgi:hypothetical protein
MSSQVVWARATGIPGSLLVSPFNVKGRFFALAGGVEGSKFCLFSVILPAKCFSSISPRFHYKRLAFCFLPLAAILESFLILFLIIATYLNIHGLSLEKISRCSPVFNNMDLSTGKEDPRI